MAAVTEFRGRGDASGLAATRVLSAVLPGAARGDARWEFARVTAFGSASFSSDTGIYVDVDKVGSRGQSHVKIHENVKHNPGLAIYLFNSGLGKSA